MSNDCCVVKEDPKPEPTTVEVMLQRLEQAASVEFPADQIRPVLEEHQNMLAALREIEAFGHSGGHGRGYTCANMAQKAIDGEPFVS